MVTSRIWFTAAQKAELWERWKNGLAAKRTWADGAENAVHDPCRHFGGIICCGAQRGLSLTFSSRSCDALILFQSRFLVARSPRSCARLSVAR
jgi:hypothetical protein